MYQLNASTQFTERTKSVFDTLATIEKSHATKSAEYKTDPCLDLLENLSPNDVTSEPVGEITEKLKDLNRKRRDERIFYKVPEPVKRCYQKRKPDFQINPEKWKKYDLKDVKDISERTNYAAAMSFLHAKNPIMEVDERADEPEIVFNKPMRKKILTTSTEEDDGESLEEEVVVKSANDRSSKAKRTIQRCFKKPEPADEEEGDKVNIVCLRKNVTRKKESEKRQPQVIDDDFKELDETESMENLDDI